MNDFAQALASLLRQTGHEHHQAFISTHGDDPDWAAWYADYLRVRLPMLLFVEWSQDQIAQRLTQLDREQRTFAPSTAWADYYAEALSKDARTFREGQRNVTVVDSPAIPVHTWKRAS